GDRTVADVVVFVPHQADRRIIDHAARRLGLSEDKVVTNVDRFGNTSAASIPICLDEAHSDRRIKAGDVELMTGFGGGLSWGSCVMEWTLPQKEARSTKSGSASRDRGASAWAWAGTWPGSSPRPRRCSTRRPR